MRRIFFIVLLSVGHLTAGASASVDETISPPLNRGETENCGGVFTAPDEAGPPFFVPAADDWVVDLGVLVLRMSSNHSERTFNYIADVLEDILPSMVEILGPPLTLDTLNVLIDSSVIQQYRCWNNTIIMQGVHYDPGTENDRGWNNLFIHELTHAFMDDLLCSGAHISWLTEGIAEAARYFVSERATVQSGREVRNRRFDQRMAVYDLFNNAGEQVWGGTGTIAYRIELDILYLNAAGAVIVPAMAQITAGLDDPHPLRRLNDVFRETKNGPSPHQIMDMFDRAWTAPVDGISPPSRWMRTRALACPSVRNGEVLGLIPAFWYNSVNPKKLRILQFTRTGSLYEEHMPSATLRFTGVDGFAASITTDYDWPVVPSLDEGAYLVELTSEGQGAAAGETLEARSWVLWVDRPFVGELLWEGVAVVFVDETGRPVDIPRESLSVNGRIMARVPGGVIALPYSGNLGDLTFKRNGRVIGTVTATGELPRLAVLPVNGGSDPPSVVAWTPYHPERGKTVTVTFRRDRSSLDPNGTGDVEAVLYDVDAVVQDREVMAVSSEDENLYSAELDVPADLTHGILAFDDGTSVHEAHDARYGWFWGYEFETRPAAGVDQHRVAFDGRRLIVTFDHDVDTADLILRTASDPSGPWTDRPEAPAEQDGQKIVWNVRGLIGNGTYFQIAETNGGEGVLLTYYISPAPTAVSLSPGLPFPNPTSGAVRWPFDVAAPLSAALEIYDVAGRRVFSTGKTTLYPGVEVFRWDGFFRDRAAPAGVYFMRVEGAGRAFNRKIVIVR